MHLLSLPLGAARGQSGGPDHDGRARPSPLGVRTGSHHLQQRFCYPERFADGSRFASPAPGWSGYLCQRNDLRFQRFVEGLTDVAHEVDRHRLTHTDRDVIELGLVAIGQDHF